MRVNLRPAPGPLVAPGLGLFALSCHLVALIDIVVDHLSNVVQILDGFPGVLGGWVALPFYQVLLCAHDLTGAYNSLNYVTHLLSSNFWRDIILF